MQIEHMQKIIESTTIWEGRMNMEEEFKPTINPAFSDILGDMTYTKIGDYFYPDVCVPAPKNDEPVGKYGLLRRNYLKEHRTGKYNVMFMRNTLLEHMQETNRKAYEMQETLLEDMLKADPGPDKMQDQMGWVAHQNNLLQRVEEIILQELIYS